MPVVVRFGLEYISVSGIDTFTFCNHPLGQIVGMPSTFAYMKWP